VAKVGEALMPRRMLGHGKLNVIVALEYLLDGGRLKVSDKITLAMSEGHDIGFLYNNGVVSTMNFSTFCYFVDMMSDDEFVTATFRIPT
jgi:hypothetical protein